MADEVLKIITLADTTKAVASLKALDAEVNKVGESGKKASQSFSGPNGPFGDMFAQLKSMSGELATLRGGLGTTTEAITAGGEAAMTAAESTSLLGGAIAGLGGPLAIVTGAIAAQAAALAVLGGVALEAGIQFNDTMAVMSRQTGETGAKLQTLGQDFLSVFATVPQSGNEVAEVMTKLHQRFDATGGSLQNATRNILDFARVTGTPVKAALDGTLQTLSSWDLNLDDTAHLLDMLTVASQKSGIPIQQLTGFLENNDAILKQFGFNLETSVSLLANLEKRGVSIPRVLSGMARAAPTFAKAGIEPEAGFREAVSLIESSSNEDALKVAKQVFGKGAVAVEMVDAIRTGAFDIAAMNEALDQSAGALAKAAGGALTLTEQLALLKNISEALVTPFGTVLANTIMTVLIPAVSALASHLLPTLYLLERLVGLTPTLSDTDLSLATHVGPKGAAPALSVSQIAALSGKGVSGSGTAAATAAPTRSVQQFLDQFKTEKQGQKLPELDKRIRSFLTPERAESQDKIFHIRYEEFVKEQERLEKVSTEIFTRESDIRIANASTEAEKMAIAHEIEKKKYEETELFKTATTEEQTRLRGLFEDEYQAKRREASRERQVALQDDILTLQAGVSGGQGPLARFREQRASLAVRQQIELRKARDAGKDAAEITLIEQKQGLEVLKLQQDQYDQMFDKVKTQAEGVFDAIFLRGKKGFAGLLDYIKGTFITALKDEFGNLVSRLFLGARPGTGGSATGGLLGGLGSLFRQSQAAGAGGGGFNFGGLFGGGSQGGGIFSLAAGAVGGGGGGLVAPAPQILSDAFGNLSLGSGGGGGLVQGTPPFSGTGAGGGPLGQAGLLSSFKGLSGSSIGRFLSGSYSGNLGIAGALTAGIGAGFGAGFGAGRLLQIGGARSAIAGGVGAGFGAVGTAFFGPGIGAAIGAAAGALTALGLRIFGGKAIEAVLAKEIQRDFGIKVVDNKLLRQIKTIGESTFGGDFKKHRFETLRLDPVQMLLSNYALMTGQSQSMLPIYQKFYGNTVASRFDPTKGIPALATGGIVSSPTLALVGEKGPEAVIPLNQVGTQPTIVLNVGTDAAGFSAMLPRIKRELTQAVADGMKRDLGARSMRQAVFGS